MPLPKSIHNVNDVRIFVDCLVEEENLNFHPDIPFAEYVSLSLGTPVYTYEECLLRENLLDQCFALSSNDVYDIGLQRLIQEIGLPVMTDTVSNWL